MRRVLLFVGLAVVLLGALFVGWVTVPRSVAFAKERRATDEAWRKENPGRIGDFGKVNRLSVRPLVEAFASDRALSAGGGVSYLLTADDTTILFDVGGNPKEESPVPVLANAAKLGVDLGAVDMVVISHLHPDHVGDLSEVLASPQLSRTGPVPVYLPAQPRKSRQGFKVVEGPTVLAGGVASIGPIAKAYWGMGTVVEQSLAVNVAGKGIVLIVGCGHQSLDRILKRADALFEAPVFGVIGGLHYPATEFRGAPGWVSVLMRMSTTGEQPWHGLFGKSDVRRAIALLDERHLGLVALSPHDSCDWTLAEFKRAFGSRSADVAVGREIEVLQAPAPMPPGEVRS